MSWKLGSLFDGSGGFPLAGTLCDVNPRWASEIEPYPIAVTRSRFPNMKHFGDISKINGAEVEPVDIITFGSPCQDLSVAGKRAGLKHEANGDEETTRSGLFMEAVRIIKEMREATNGEYPRFALWENVPGAFSSNKGEDFRIVLEELIKIVEPGATMPAVPKKGWPYADSYCGDGWSLAYRVFDAQYWGVPQRRRRIHLVLDLRGECAGEVLAQRPGLRGHLTQGRTAWESLAADAEGGVGADDCQGIDGYNAALTGDKAATIGVNCGISTGRNGVLVPYTLKIRSGCEGGGKGALIQTDQSATLATNNDQYLFQPIAVATQQGGAEITEDGICPTITAAAGMSGNNQPWIVDRNILDDQGGSQISVRIDGKVPTLRAEMHGNVPCVLEAAGFKELNSAKARSNGYGHEIAPTLSAEKHDASVCVGVLASSAVNAEYTDGSIAPCSMARAGTGGNQLPLVAVKSWDARGNGDGDTANTITGDHENRITDYTSVVVAPISINGDVAGTLDANYYKGCGLRQGVEREVVAIPIQDQATRFSGKRGDKYDGKGNGFGVGEPGDPMNTLTSGDRHAVAYGIDHAITMGGNCTAQGPCVYENVEATLKAMGVHAVAYAMQGFGDYKESTVASGMKARDYKDATDLVTEEKPIAIDRAFFNQGENALYDPQLSEDGISPPLIARGPNAVCVRYIVRRLTPTECARLQGFADQWGEIEEKKDFTDEEYRFWLDVRNTHAEINGKAVKDYTKKQMLTWYNKLHTDSAEYKMWGNGIALPPALYCMQGIVDVLKRANL